MSPIKQIQGLYTSDGNHTFCKGEIKILRQEQKVFYASWNMQDEKSVNLAGKTRNYFVDNEKLSESTLIELILADIKKYRIGRKKVFSEIEVVK